MTQIRGDGTAAGWVPAAATFGARLVLVRIQMRWYNADAAARAYGLPKESYRDWEKDKSKPRNRLEVCMAIAERTGCDAGWLYGGDEMTGQVRGAARAA